MRVGGHKSFKHGSVPRNDVAWGTKLLFYLARLGMKYDSFVGAS